MPLPPRPLTTVICESEPMARAAMAHAAREAGFEVLETAENGPRVLPIVELTKPSLLLVANELTGMPGHEVISVLRNDGAEQLEAILVSSDPAIRDRALEEGALAVVPRSDLDALARALGDARHLLETGERRASSDRRAGADRREKQDWSKVTQERRSGGDRRQADRRVDT